MAPTILNTMSLVEWGVAARPLPGQMVSGDAHFIKSFGDVIVMAVIDGLGHGDEATYAASRAVNVLRNQGQEAIIPLAYRCHQALVGTRGAVMTVGCLDVVDQTITWLGIGNVEGVQLRTDRFANRARESVLLRGGVLGYHLPTLKATILPVLPGDFLIFATDGIHAGFDEDVPLIESPKQLADRIMGQSFKGTDDALVLAVRYNGDGTIPGPGVAASDA